MIKKYSLSDIINMNDNGKKVVFHAKGIVLFVLNHNLAEFEGIVSEFMDARDKIIVKYGEKNPDGTSSVRDPDNLVKANDEIKELLVTEYEKDIVVIPETKTLDCGLNSEQLSCISWMIRRCDSNDIRELLGIEDVEQKEFDKKNADKYDPKEPINDPDFI